MQHVLKDSFFEDTGFTGEVTIEVPLLDQRLGYQVEMSKMVESMGEDAYGIFFSKIAHKHLLDVKVKHTESGEDITDKEEIFYVNEAATLLMKVGSAIVRGKLLGKK